MTPALRAHRKIPHEGNSAPRRFVQWLLCVAGRVTMTSACVNPVRVTGDPECFAVNRDERSSLDWSSFQNK
ncbi:hypothetical protein MGG_15912 [Pyricularia oryzae 70-15]|uniref:Uncharacterized protein n=1 Tax=Pyricularia oryzae (strain 70-15 / ATCC MYA-4617 / FGSC 8958) TaxID=242507 RepID=G4MVH2_PYRO7|nr:uncharacterized protein MGG_15912 [Pyricularia oryzae 70-15]EHA55798.1 hypothetical protein MGG_15912 [Pyricularia oryzae 70-15]